ncbi:MAG: phospholipid/cholesterol/gamma-HCH transport system substrate-binding protein [Frankiaceae bacterium]|nr:phospholipid/cholesterol/gamma-HCH transport system substrate-binding protein [Frankiaceae bacterium]
MIGRSVWIKAGVFVVIAVLGISYILLHYIGLGQTLLGQRYTAYVDLSDSGGLFTTASVTYRGVEVGRVGGITLRPNGIRVALELTSTTKIPAGTAAVVGNGSPIGEQFIDLRPSATGGPYLHAGSVIPQSRTTLPVSTQDLLVNLDRLVNSVPRNDLHTVVTELGTAFAETGPDLRRLLDSTHALLASAQAALPQTVSLIQDSGTVLDTQNSLSSSIVRFSNNLAKFTDALRSSDTDLRAVIDNGAPAATQLIALDHSIDATLPILLGNLTSLGQVTAVRIPALRQILIIYPYVVATSFGLFPGNGSTRFGVPIPPANDHQPCKKGYLNPAKRRLPTALKYPPIRYGSFCKEPTSADVNVRGARMAPEPDGKRLGDEPSYRQNKGLPGGGGSSGVGTARVGATSIGTGLGQLFSVPDGSSYVLGSTGGEQRVLGDRSWMWLLFGPMS